jgi:hypothetical protein
MIQVDMFEVQLGASLLLQFKTPEDEIIRVLADAGEGPPIDVHTKLTDAFKTFGGGDRRIDLLMGTHYDADHLDGLIPIINDKTIAITEAWLPPIANDTETHAFDESPADHQLLPNQLYSSSGRQILRRYLETKNRICEQLRPQDGELASEYKPREGLAEEAGLDRARQMFKTYRDEAIRSLHTEPGRYSHADDDQFDPPDLKELLKAVPWSRRWPYHDWLPDRELADFAAHITKSVTPGSIAAQNLAQIRKSAANDAINAISLARLVDALRARKVPIVCQIIPDGTPRRFVWRRGSGRFEGGANLPAQGPAVVLLGPSEGLVRKHWNRLPIGTYAMVAGLAMIPIKSITPSNQLSYVARFEAEEQGILVTGDAGCVDFRSSRSASYYPELLDSLLPLHVVQVAHHAGNNAHFYRVLSKAHYPQGVSHSYLLVSHATDDVHRPSREFRWFLENIHQEPEIANILFTTQPRAEKVRDFIPLVHQPVGRIATEGDVRLEFRNGTWTVTKHAIKV